MTGDLVRVQRTDRNGRTQTRWVRPQPPGPTSVQLPAAPAPAAPESSIGDRCPVVRALFRGRGRQDRELAMFHPDLLERLEGLLSDAEGYGYGRLARGIENAAAEEPLDPATLHNFALFGDLLDPEELGTEVGVKIFLLGLTHRGTTFPAASRAPVATACFANVADFSYLPPERIEQARALVRGAIHLPGAHLRYVDAWNGGGMAGPPRRLVQTDWVAELLMERPARAEDIIDIINGGAADEEAVRAALDTPARALREGVL